MCPKSGIRGANDVIVRSLLAGSLRSSLLQDFGCSQDLTWNFQFKVLRPKTLRLIEPIQELFCGPPAPTLTCITKMQTQSTYEARTSA